MHIFISICSYLVLFEYIFRFSKMVNKMGRVGLTKETTLQNLARNPQQILNKMQAAIDPRILKQMGGAGNIMNIFKEVIYK